MSKLSSFAYGLFSGATIITPFFNNPKNFTIEDHNYYILGVGVSSLTILACGFFIFTDACNTTYITITQIDNVTYTSIGADINRILKGLGITMCSVTSLLGTIYSEDNSMIEDHKLEEITQIEAIGVTENSSIEYV